MKRSRFATFTAVVFIIALLIPEQAWAWGAGVHLYLGNYFLANLHLLTASSAQAISAHPFAFLYGVLSADMLVGKGKELTPDHCHSWNAGFSLLHSAREQQLKAYAQGYLAHLAADVVAHNYYVPNMLQLQRNRGKMGHVSIEMQADRQMCYCPEELRQIVQTPWKEADKQLLRTLRKSRVTFSVKKMIYKGGVSLTCLNHNLENPSWRLNGSQAVQSDYLSEMIDLSKQVVMDCLNRQKNSEVTRFDPMGFENLSLVKRHPAAAIAPSSRKRDMAVFFIPAMCLLTL